MHVLQSSNGNDPGKTRKRRIVLKMQISCQIKGKLLCHRGSMSASASIYK